MRGEGQAARRAELQGQSAGGGRARDAAHVVGLRGGAGHPDVEHAAADGGAEADAGTARAAIEGAPPLAGP
eukprot:4803517-Lingulodinium_polyedra.AAC.1